VKGKYHQRIRDTETDGAEWAAAHWKAIELNYRRAAHFPEIAEWLKPLYADGPPANLSRLNRLFLERVCAYLGIRTRLSNSWDYRLADGKTERLADLCAQCGASEYISGPAAKSYVDENAFRERGIKLTWFDYGGYPEYPQLWGAFAHGVTILDLLFNCGKDSPKYMRYVK